MPNLQADNISVRGHVLYQGLTGVHHYAHKLRAAERQASGTRYGSSLEGALTVPIHLPFILKQYIRVTLHQWREKCVTES